MRLWEEVGVDCNGTVPKNVLNWTDRSKEEADCQDLDGKLRSGNECLNNSHDTRCMKIWIIIYRNWKSGRCRRKAKNCCQCDADLWLRGSLTSNPEAHFAGVRPIATKIGKCEKEPKQINMCVIKYQQDLSDNLLGINHCAGATELSFGI